MPENQTAIAPALQRETKPIQWGDGCYAIVRQDRRSGRLIEVVRAHMQLSVIRQEIVVTRADDLAAGITAPGAERLNTVAGVSIVTTPSVSMPDGSTRPNPWIEADEHGTAIRVHVRRIGLGYSPLGTLVAQDETLAFDVRSYLFIDLLKKMTKWDGSGRSRKQIPVREFGFIVDLDAPGDVPKGWKVFPYRQGLGLAIDIQSPQFLSILDTDAQRVKFAERIAQSICRRNALLHHPAIGTRKVELTDPWAKDVREAMRAGENPPDTYWKRKSDRSLAGSTTVYGWREATLQGHQDIQDFAVLVAHGDEAEAFTRLEDRAPKGQKQDTVRQTTRMADEEDSDDVDRSATAASGDAGQPESPRADTSDAEWGEPERKTQVAVQGDVEQEGLFGEEKTEPKAEPKAGTKAAVLQSLADAAEIIGEDRFGELLQECEVDPNAIGNAKVDVLRTILRRASAIAEEAER